MDVSKAIKTRRSIRQFQDKPIEPQKLERVLEVARLAPSAKNLQERKFVLVQDKDLKEKLAQAAKNQTFIAQAPVVIVACGLNPDYIMSSGQPAYPIDLAIALDHLSLEAVEEGLGTCWIGGFDEARVKEILDIPLKTRVVGLMPLGYPAYIPPPPARKPKEELFTFDKWS